MEINVIGQHFEITNSIQEYIIKKFNKLKFPDKISKLQIRLSIKNKKEHHAQINFHCLNKDLHIESTEINLYQSIDVLIEKTKRSFVKIKEKKHIHFH